MNAIYHQLSKIPVVKYNYSLKFLFVAFIGIHIPLIGIIAYVLNSPAGHFSTRVIVVTALIFTLLSTMATLYVLNNLLAPILMANKALESYTDSGMLPNLPNNYEDQAGRLMFLIQETVTHLDQLANEKQEVITLISHNLRTPLNQIVGLCDLMKIDEENITDYIGKIEAVTQLQLQSLSDLLTQLMSKGAKLRINERVPYNLNEFISTEIKVVKDLLVNKKLEIVMDITADLPNVIKSKINLSLAFQNLLSNAIKFSNKGGKIYVSTIKNNDLVEIEVRDEGIGFSESYKTKIFKDARHMGRKGTNNEPSIGLGLHLSKKVIENLGGKLLAFSEGDGKGASFKIMF